ncbi:TadE family type IV pilus minor pilin [Streptomyces sp. SID10362]|uniref:TadE family type IV pilus minor pilin n=1 Tax=Streptomyces sp. SID10362 TaxID=2706021 RepID=UPI0024072626|nr:TadE family type IV pilus minor pilin [Streptomyces sp. SID10362]
MRGCERVATRRAWTRGVRGRRPHSGPDGEPRSGRDGGFVTAETAVVLPVLVVFAMALVWGLLVVAAQIQCVGAARTGARAAARQDPADAVVEVAREAAPRGARVTVSREAGLVRVVVVADPPALHGLPFEVREEAVASVEQSVGTAPAGAES